MRVWSTTLTARDFHECAKEVNAEFPGTSVYVSGNAEDPTRLVRGPRAGCLRFDHVHLRSRTGRYYPNPGKSGGGYHAVGELAASWTEWGWWLSRLFERDPDARCGGYDGAEDFHTQTFDRFREPRTPRERQIRRELART